MLIAKYQRITDYKRSFNALISRLEKPKKPLPETRGWVLYSIPLLVDVISGTNFMYSTLDIERGLLLMDLVWNKYAKHYIMILIPF